MNLDKRVQKAAKPCSKCGRRMFFAPHHQTGRMMPMDAEPLDNDSPGFVLVEGGHPARVTLEHMDVAKAGERKRYQSHFATCPSASSFRKSR